MCRLLGRVSVVPATLAWGVMDAPRSLLQQSNACPAQRQSDGWGVGWYKARHPQWVKSPKPLYEESDRAARALHDSPARVAIAHIRRASNPLKLSRRKLLQTESAQPFAFKQYLFAHNGTLHIPREVAASLGPAQRNIRGVNDSEVLFHLFVKCFEETGRFCAAYRAMVQHLQATWAACAHDGLKEPFTGLNILFSDGQALYAACLAGQRRSPPRNALCSTGWPFWRMCYRTERDRGWIASEPLDDRPGWRPLGPGRCVRMEVVQGRVRVQGLDV